MSRIANATRASLALLTVTTGWSAALAEGKIYVVQTHFEAPAHIFRANLDGSDNEILIPDIFAYDIALDLARSRMYWSEPGYPTGRIRSSSLTGQLVENVIPVTEPRGIAIDSAGAKLYWSHDDGRIHRSDLNGSNQETIVDGIGARQIALDVQDGRVYWTEEIAFVEGSIRRAKLDGTDIEDLVLLDHTPREIAVDPDGGKVYWVEPHPPKIRRANLDGSDPEDLVAEGAEAWGLALDLRAGKLYWSDSGEISGNPGFIGRANLDGSGQAILFVWNSGMLSIALDAQGVGTDVPALSGSGLAILVGLLLAVSTAVLLRRKKRTT